MKLKIITLLSLVVWGERPDLLGIIERERGAMLVAHVFVNRLESGGFGNTPGDVAASGFWGYQVDTLPPTPDWVNRVVSETLETGDFTNGALYMFSRHDLTRNNWTWNTATAQAGSGTYALYAFLSIPPTFPKSPSLTLQ